MQYQQKTEQSLRMMRARVLRYYWPIPRSGWGESKLSGRVSKPHSSATPKSSIALRMHPIAHPDHPFRNPHGPEETLWPLNCSGVRRAGCFS